MLYSVFIFCTVNLVETCPPCVDPVHLVETQSTLWRHSSPCVDIVHLWRHSPSCGDTVPLVETSPPCVDTVHLVGPRPPCGDTVHLV